MFNGPSATLVNSLGSDVKNGLSHEEAERRLAANGPNALQAGSRSPWWMRFASQFFSLMIGLLVAAAILSGFLGDWVDAVAILAIVAINAFLGFFQEERAEKAMEALSRLSAPQAKVKRAGEIVAVGAERLVVGDIILLEAGDRVPADARIIDEFGLHTQESSLTGESNPIAKQADIELLPNTSLAERTNCLFAGTSVVSGKATALVVTTGMDTEIGGIARLLQATVNEQTPLQRRLTELGKVLVGICLSLVSVIFVLQWLRGGEFVEVFLTSVSLAVAAIPEGLPAVVTVTLAIGLQRMAKRNAIIRKLPSVETLGCVTVICSDKTGTLTRNEMMVRQIWVSDQSWSVDGQGYAPSGDIRPIGQPKPTALPTALPTAVLELLRLGDTCNNSQWRFDSETNTAVTVGDPTEIALKVAAAKAGATSRWSLEDLIHENPFESDRKRMSQVYRKATGEYVMIVKGASEEVLAISNHLLIGDTVSPMNDAMKRRILQCNSEMASQALRVLAIAFRPAGDDVNDWRMESGLTFVGLVGMIDPPRLEAMDAVNRCRNAGIRPVMITGDHPLTALAIAKAIGIADSDGTVLLGASIDQMSDSELVAQVPNCSVVARVTAHHKLRVVNAWKSNGNIVAMTGDGVNDAPAVKAADIGVVMGITGTDVAKEAADMVLTDDNFVSIVNAVEEGRGIYENIRKFLHFLLACNSSEVLFMFTASMIGWPSPLLAIQILWINLITDGLPALALASEPLGKGLMERPPRSVDEPILSWKSGRLILAHGVLMASVTLVGFWWSYQGSAEKLDEARAVAFCILTLTQIFYSMACRDFDRIMPRLGVFSNPFLVLAMIGSLVVQLVAIACPWSASILGLHAMPWSDLPFILFLSLIPVTLVELRKMLSVKKGVPI